MNKLWTLAAIIGMVLGFAGMINGMTTTADLTADGWGTDHGTHIAPTSSTLAQSKAKLIAEEPLPVAVMINGQGYVQRGTELRPALVVWYPR